VIWSGEEGVAPAGASLRAFRGKARQCASGMCMHGSCSEAIVCASSQCMHIDRHVCTNKHAVVKNVERCMHGSSSLL
jgi:hypothetical protein